MSPDLMEGCHTGKPKHETPILITDFLADDVIMGTPVRLPTVQLHPRLLPLRAMSLAPLVSQNVATPKRREFPVLPGNSGYSRLLRTRWRWQNGLHLNAYDLRHYYRAACHRYLCATCLRASNGQRDARGSGTRPRLSLRQSDQRDQRCKAFKAGCIVLGSSLRTKFLHDEVGTRHGRAYSAFKVAPS